jgi:hypothetical protein
VAAIRRIGSSAVCAALFELGGLKWLARGAIGKLRGQAGGPPWQGTVDNVTALAIAPLTQIELFLTSTIYDFNLFNFFVFLFFWSLALRARK